MRPGGPGREKRTDRVYGEMPLQVVLVRLGKAGPANDAGVIDQNVHAPEVGDGRLYEDLGSVLG